MLLYQVHQGWQASRGGGGKLSRASHSLSSTKSDPGQWADGTNRFKLRRNFSSFLSKPYLSTSCRWGVRPPALGYLIKFVTVGPWPCINSSPVPAPSSRSPTPTVFPTIEIYIWRSPRPTFPDTRESLSPARQEQRSLQFTQIYTWGLKPGNLTIFLVKKVILQ